MPQIKHPHPDIDLKRPRGPIDYEVAFPENGAESERGFIFYIGGYGDHYDDLHARKLRRFLADTYNCIVCTVDYFGSRSNRKGLDKLSIPPDFFRNIRSCFNIDFSVEEKDWKSGEETAALLSKVFQVLNNCEILSLPKEAFLVRDTDQYHSFSVLPAIDHIQVLNKIQSKYRINKKRVFTPGFSYGGHIALLLNKIAPNTFRLIIDNSGFSSHVDSLSEIYGHSRVVGPRSSGVSACVLKPVHFSSDSSNPNFFDSHHAALRTLAFPSHYNPSETVIHSYHSSHDLIAPIGNKKHVHTVLRKFRPCMLHIVNNEAQLDGRLFKHLDHGMGASMRAMFKKSYDMYMDSSPPAPDHTDFDLETRLELPCRKGRSYLVSYSRQGINVELV